MSDYSFNGTLPTMQDALRAMAALSNVGGQPSAEEQRKFVENAHISFKEIDNLDEWKEQNNVTERGHCFVNLYCDGKKVSDKIYCVPRYDDYTFLKELNSNRFEIIRLVEVRTYETKEEVESHNRFCTKKPKSATNTYRPYIRKSFPLKMVIRSILRLVLLEAISSMTVYIM